MNVKSRFAQDELEAQKPETKYMFLGYGDYVNYGGAVGRLMDGGLARSPHFLDAIFEALKIKTKVRRRSEGEE